MATYLITGVTAGITSVVSDGAQVDNHADTLAPEALDSAVVPTPIVAPYGASAFVALDLSAAYTPPPGTALSLALSGPPLVLAGLAQTDRHGTPLIQNAAQAAYPSGFDLLAFGGKNRATADETARRLQLDLNGTYNTPTALNVGLYLDGRPLVAGASIGAGTAFGTAEVEAPLSVRPPGFDETRWTLPVVHTGGSGAYVELALGSDYSPPEGTAISLALSGAPMVLGAGGDQALFGETAIANAAQAFYPEGIRSPAVAMSMRAMPSEEEAGGLLLDLVGNYEPPSAWAIQLLWAGEDKTLAPFGIDAGSYGTAIVRVATLYLDGIEAPDPGQPDIRNRNREVYPPGADALSMGDAHHVENTGVAIYPNGNRHSGYGKPYIYNLLQLIRAKGFSTSGLGRDGFIMGGVKWIKPKGLSLLRYGSITVINTTADQGVKAKGIGKPGLGKPSVSPRMIYPVGIHGTTVEGAQKVQFPPHPLGWDSAVLGNATIDYWTVFIEPDGIEYGEVLGYPVVFDPTQEVFTPAILGTGIFGDVAVANRSALLYPEGFDAFQGSDWAELRNNRRHLLANGADTLTYGDTSIRNKTPSVAPYGIDSLRSSTGFVDFRVRYIYGRGVDGLSAGKGKVTKTPSIEPDGIKGAIGRPVVWFHIRRLEVTGKDLHKRGTPTVWHRLRSVTLSGINAGRYGKPKVEHGNRELLVRGSGHGKYGRPRLSNADRTLEPESIYTEFASSHMVGGLRFLNPVGFDAALFGTRVIPERQSVYPMGFAGGYGEPLVYSTWQIVAPDSVKWAQSADRWGKGSVWNRLQYIQLYFDPDSHLNPPEWPQWTLVENRNKTISTTGIEFSRIGGAQVDNAARPLLPESFTAPGAGDGALVAMRYRPLQIDGLEAPYMTGWHRIYNDAFVIGAEGFAGDGYGSAAVVNTRRYYNWVGGYDTARLGYPMVADRIRELSIEKRYTIGSPTIQGPTVKLYTRYVDGIGYQADGIGLATLSIHWTLITPRWTLQNLYGYPVVFNVTPELGTRGRSSEAFGDPFLRLEWRPVEPDGKATELFGRSMVADRDRTISVAGLQAMAVGSKLKVIRTGSPPYSLQIITLDGEEDDSGESQGGNGIEPPKYQVSKPVLNQQVAYVKQDDAMTKFGDAMVEANSVRVEPGYFEKLIGDHVIWVMTQYVTVGEFESDQVHEPTKARVSPHTIYAVVEAPAQAKKNHPLGGTRHLHYIDGYKDRVTEVFGRPRLSLRHRTVKHKYGANVSRYGKPKLELLLNYIYPDSMRTFRSGFHSVPGPQTAVQFDAAKSDAYGKPKIWHYVPPGPRSVKPKGLNAGKFGSLLIEHFNREIFPKGTLMQKVGSKKNRDTPYMWQGLRVGPLMPTIPDGVETSALGEPWVSRRVRDFTVEGFDAFVSEYQLEAFDQRMRVRNAYIPMPEEQEVDPAGGAHGAMGTPNIQHGARYIRPDGNADQYRKGAF